MKKLFGVVTVLIVLAVIALVASSATNKPVVEVVTPTIGTIRAYVEEQAVTELPQDYLVAMPIDGWLEPIELREGDAVKAGDIVAKLDLDDLTDRVRQADQRMEDLQTKIRETKDNRLELHALEETEATVVAMAQTVQAAEAKLAASKAVADFAASEVDRLQGLEEADAATKRELRAATTEQKRTEAVYRSDALELSALRTLEAVSHIGPRFVRDLIDRKNFTRESYEKQLEEARATRSIQHRNLDRARIEAPVDGVVLHRHQTRRQFLPAGTPLLTVGRLDDMEIIAEILTERATRITPGAVVEVFGGAIIDSPVPGRVSRVYPAGFTKISSLGVEQQRVNVAVTLDSRPPRLGVGYRVHVRILYDEAERAMIVPRTALFRGPDGAWQVLLVQDGKVVAGKIEVGILTDMNAQVISGVSDDSLVVLRPSRDIDPGMSVQPVRTGS